MPKQKVRSYHSQDEGLGMGRAGNDFESSWVEGRGFFYLWVGLSWFVMKINELLEDKVPK